MELRELTADNIEEHLPACLQLQMHLVNDVEAISSEQFVATAYESNSYFLGVFEVGTLIGMGVATKIVHPVATNAYINNIVVSPEHRGKGCFGSIMDELERKASEWNCTRVDLTCSREQVQGMYEKRGYVLKETNFYILKL